MPFAFSETHKPLMACSASLAFKHLSNCEACRYNLQPDPCDDFLLSWFCCACAQCQETREMRIRAEHAALEGRENVLAAPGKQDMLG